jgi:polysaccharide chain length determinant protein (PEP-CTERM system associated)
LKAIEGRRAEFRRKYLDILPLEDAGGQSHLDAARQAVNALEAQISDATAKSGVLQDELRTIPPVIRDTGGAGSPQAQLAAAQEKLAQLRLQYTDQHPDVIAQRHVVDWLKKHASEAPAAATSRAPTVVPNPVYTQVHLQILESRATISVLEAQLRKARADLARMEALARAAPKVGAEYRDLERGYDVLHKNYDELLARRQQSNITEAADTEGDKVRLRVVDPPEISRIPVAPPRLMLISAVLAAGLGAGVALAVLLGQLDRSIWDLGRLGELGHPVLGGISIRQSAVGRWTLYPQAAGVTIAVLTLIAVYGGLLTATAATNKVLL